LILASGVYNFGYQAGQLKFKVVGSQKPLYLDSRELLISKERVLFFQTSWDIFTGNPNNSGVILSPHGEKPISVATLQRLAGKIPVPLKPKLLGRRMGLPYHHGENDGKYDKTRDNGS
jgi:hypothetical protein